MSNNEMRAEHDADADLDASSSARNVPYNPPPSLTTARYQSACVPSDNVTRQDLGLGRRIPQTLIDVPPGRNRTKKNQKNENAGSKDET